MRLSRLDLTRYGKFTGFSLDFGAQEAAQPDLHIVYGPNEAGKTTGFSAFLDLLFGIEPRSRFNFLHPYATMQVGGLLEWDGAAHELVRVKRAANSLLGSNGQPVSDAALKGALGGIDRDAYRTMFSLDDETLEKGGDSILESRGDLGQLLFSASAGLADFSRTLETLRAEADSFYKYRAHKSALAGLKAQLAALRESREAIDTLASAYAQLTAERDGSFQAYEAAAGGLAAVRTRIEAVGRLAAAHGPWLRLQSLKATLAEGEDRPAPPASWSDELAVLQREAIELETRRAAGVATAERLEREVAALPVDGLALGLRHRFKPLGGLAAAALKAEAELPGERAALAEVERVLQSLARGLDREDADPAALPLPAAAAARLRELAEDGKVLRANAEAAERERRGAGERREQVEARLQAAGGEGRNVEAVRAALSALRGSDALLRQRAAERERQAAAALLAERLLALFPWQGAPEALASLPLPSPERIEGWKAGLAAAGERLAEAEKEAERWDRERIRLRAEAEADRDAGLPDEAAMQAARAAREKTWAAHRDALDAASADAFEAALRTDDALSAARAAQAQEWARSRETGRALGVAQAAFARETAGAEAARDRLARLVSETEAAFASAVPGMPAKMPLADWQSWMVRRNQVLESWSAERAARREGEAAGSDLAEATAELRDALRAAGSQAEGEALLPAAEALLAREAEFRALRSEAENARREEETRAAQARAAQVAVEHWETAWKSACASTWIGPDAAPSGVRAILDTLAELGPVLEKRAGIRARVARLEADREGFAREVEGLALLLGLSRTAADPLRTFENIGARIREAETAEERRNALARELRRIEEESRALAEAAALHARRAGAMTAFFGVGSLEEVGRRLTEAARRRSLKTERDTLEREVAQALGQADASAQAAALIAFDPGSAKAELAELAARAAEEESRTREFYARYRQAFDKVEAVGGDDAVARIEAERKTVLIDIEERALHHLRLRVGIAAAEAALRAYREKHRSSMMEQASQAFRTVSRSAYSGLSTQPGRDGDVLVGLTADGASKLAPDMSKGTRFQLYLALRVAGYHEFARARQPVPFIADDIMETFDDFRAEEAFRLFAGMAEVGQVVYLTHHRHLCEIAREVCPTVRVHELPAASPS